MRSERKRGRRASVSGRIEEIVTCSMISSTRPAFTASGLIMSTDTSFLVGTGREKEEEEEGKGRRERGEGEKEG